MFRFRFFNPNGPGAADLQFLGLPYAPWFLALATGKCGKWAQHGVAAKKKRQAIGLPLRCVENDEVQTARRFGPVSLVVVADTWLLAAD
jgi:hypothetical protein